MVFKANGKTTKLTGKANFSTLTGTFSMENGSKTKPTVMASTTTLMERNTKVIGRMICSMVMVRKFGPMDLSMMGTTTLARNREKVLFYLNFPIDFLF